MTAPRPWWDAEVFARRRPHLDARARIVKATRALFDGLAFVEVETPALQVSPGLEPHLAAFATDLIAADRQSSHRLYLHTSPEFAMKKLLAAGLPRIFQLARVFRNAERSGLHHPEFTMLEWYRAGAGYRDLIDDCRALLTAVLAATPGATRFRRQDASADPAADWTVLTVAQAFDRYAGIDILATAPDPLAPDLMLLDAACRHIGHAARPGDRWDDLFFRIFLDRIEPQLGRGAPAVLTDYPVSMAALARPKPDDPRLAERFEVYVCGVELANAFGELTDPEAQAARFADDIALKQALYGETYPVDPDFLAALARMPEAAGIALGFDRLVMLATGADDIDQVLWAPVAAPDAPTGENRGSKR